MNILGIALLLQVQLATASGVVTKPGGSEPVPGATVVLTPTNATQTGKTRSTVAEDNGRFTINDIEPGEYRLQAQSALLGVASYGQRRDDGSGSILIFVAGQRLSELKLSMPVTGTIAGRVTGRDGEPIAYANVQALKYVYQDGKRVLTVAQMTTTDDRGQYRLFWLHGGKYLVLGAPRSVAASPTGATLPTRPGAARGASDAYFEVGQVLLALAADALFDGANLVKRILEDGTVREESWLPTYYPSTTDRNLAPAVDVRGGSTVTGIDITLGGSPVQKIRGRVTGFTAGSQATVTLLPLWQGTTGRMLAKQVNMSDGSFEYAGVAPGPYYVAAQDRTGLVASPVAVLVGDREVENLSIALGPAVSVSVQVTAEGVPDGVADPLAGIIGSLRSQMDSTLQGPGRILFSTLGPTNTVLRPGGPMLISNVPPGDYQFDISQGVVRDNMKRLYIKSVRLGREEALETVRISPDMKSVLLEVVLTTDTGAVGGVALSRTGDPAASATIVLIPANARKRTSLYKTALTGSDGRFSFQEIPAGDYKLFAWDDVETGAWQNEEFIRQFESRGRDARVSGNSKDEVQLNVIYNP